jgi:hypothetical protein
MIGFQKSTCLFVALGSLFLAACQPAPEATEEDLIHPDKWSLQKPVS